VEIEQELLHSAPRSCLFLERPGKLPESLVCCLIHVVRFLEQLVSLLRVCFGWIVLHNCHNRLCDLLSSARRLFMLLIQAAM
jgi:hypothetical protein